MFLKCPSCGRAIPDAVDMCPHCGYLLTRGEKARRILSARAYIGAILFFIIIGLFAAAYLTAERVEAEDLVPDSIDYMASVSLDSISDDMSSQLLPLVEEGEFDHMGAITDVASSALAAGWEDCGGASCTLIILKVDDKGSFTDMLEEAYPGETVREYRGVEVYEIHEPHAYYWAGDYCVFGEDEAVNMSIDAYKGESASLADSESYVVMAEDLSAYPVFIYAPGVPEELGDTGDLMGLEDDFGGFDAMGLGTDPESGELAIVLDFASSQDAVSMKMMLAILLSQDDSGMVESLGLSMDLEDDVMCITLTIPDDIGLDDLGLLDGGFDIPI